MRWLNEAATPGQACREPDAITDLVGLAQALAGFHKAFNVV
jgi:hypothetical protein